MGGGGQVGQIPPSIQNGVLPNIFLDFPLKNMNNNSANLLTGEKKLLVKDFSCIGINVYGNIYP